MRLFGQKSDKTPLQSALDRDARSTNQAVEELPIEEPVTRTPEGKQPIFKKPGDRKVFQVDLLGSWTKP